MRHLLERIIHEAAEKSVSGPEDFKRIAAGVKVPKAHQKWASDLFGSSRNMHISVFPGRLLLVYKGSGLSDVRAEKKIKFPMTEKMVADLWKIALKEWVPKVEDRIKNERSGFKDYLKGGGISGVSGFKGVNR